MIDSCPVVSRRSAARSAQQQQQQRRRRKRIAARMPLLSSSPYVIPTLLSLFFLVATTTTTSRMTMGMFRMVQSFPTGAGSCMGGDTAPVGDFHLVPTNPDGSERTVLSGALSDGMVSVLINTDEMTTDPLVENTPRVLQTQTLYTITVVTTQEPGYKGILLRFSNADNTMDVPNDIILDPSNALLQLATECASENNAIGLTHVTNIEKLSVASNIIFNTPGTVILDVSIVGVNDAVASLYGHTGFVLQIDGDAVTLSPTLSPTMAPVLPPGATAIPTVSPTVNDFIIETISPTYQQQQQPGQGVPQSPTVSTATTSNAIRSLIKLYGVIMMMMMIAEPLLVIVL